MAQGSATITAHHRDHQAQVSNDYWVAFPQNYEDQSGKYIQLYLSSTDSTTAYVLCGGVQQSYPVTAGVTATVNIPLSWEMKGSNAPASKAVHVWSDGAPLFVDYNSHSPYTSDASYVLPTMGWGRAYVVAAYSSLYEGFGSSSFDYPSEFVILADQDNTVVTITPSRDLRGANPTEVAHAAGIPFTVTLNAGDAVQYQCTLATDTVHFDLTGTLIEATEPVGVLGASQCANIPNDYPYCDFVCEMLQPVRTWGQTYYTAPFSGVKTGETFLVIGTKPSQAITQTTGGHRTTIATLSKPYEAVWLTDSGRAHRWESDAPFLLMLYSNSSTYPDGVNGQGDPFMMAVNAVDGFSSPVIFNVFTGAGGIKPYVWYANIIARSGVGLTVDGSTSTLHLIDDDGQYATYRVLDLPLGQHIIASDSGVSVSAYGYGYDESVGFAAAIGSASFNSPDTLAPEITPSSPDPTTLRITASDGGSNQSGLGHVELEQAENVRIAARTLVEGSGSKAGSVDIVMSDKKRPAHVRARVYDLAGNYTTITKDLPAVGSAGVSPAPHTQASGALDLTSNANLEAWLASGGSERSIVGTVTPQPASESITFRYALRTPEHVVIDLFDLLGTKVLSVASGTVAEAGLHTASADIRLLQAGSYLYRAVIGSETHSGKVLITR